MRLPWQKAIPIERASPTITIPDGQRQSPAPSGYTTYTTMYKSHPIVRAAVDKIAKASVGTGYLFRSRDPLLELDPTTGQELSDMFARSQMQRILRQVYADLMIYGDAYLFVIKSRNGVPYQFLRVAPTQVQIVIDLATRQEMSYIARDQQGAQSQYGPDEMFHFKLFDPANDVYGLSPLESLKSTVAQDIFAQTFNEAFFANSAQTGMVFNMKGASRDEVERNKETIRKEYTGPQNAHRPLVLEGDVDVSKQVATPAEMQFIEGRRQLTTEILAVYDLPYTKLGGSVESANRSQSSENDKSFRAETITPLQNIVEEVINEGFIVGTMKILDTVFAHREVDIRDESALMQDHKDGLSSGIYTLDWVRSQRGLPKVAGGDVPYLSTSKGVFPVSMLAELAANSISGNGPTPSQVGSSTVPTADTAPPPPAKNSRKSKQSVIPPPDATATPADSTPPTNQGKP